MAAVTLNIFGGQGTDAKYIGDGLWTGEGSITSEMLNYLVFAGHRMLVHRQQRPES